MHVKKMNNDGFSLVEIIIVIAIMSILVGILAVMAIKHVDSGRESVCLTNHESVQKDFENAIAMEEFTDVKSLVEKYPVSDVTVISPDNVTCKGFCPSRGLSTFTYIEDTKTLEISCSVHTH